MIKKSAYILILVGLLQSCNYLTTKEERKAIARVNETYLYEEDLAEVLPENLSEEDSTLFVNNYVKNWATELLLMDQANINLPEDRQIEFENLINDYRAELYTEAYKDLILSKQLDTTLNEEIIKEYFDANNENFKLSEDLVKFRYLYVSSDFPELDQLKKQFRGFDKEDQEDLTEEQLKFKAHWLNDSVWVTSRDFLDQVPVLKSNDQENWLKEDKFLQQEDSLGVYFVYVKEVLKRNENAPLEYAKPTIKQILLNRRKLKLSREFEKEITKDALKNNKFEIYN